MYFSSFHYFFQIFNFMSCQTECNTSSVGIPCKAVKKPRSTRKLKLVFRVIGALNCSDRVSSRAHPYKEHWSECDGWGRRELHSSPGTSDTRWKNVSLLAHKTWVGRRTPRHLWSKTTMPRETNRHRMVIFETNHTGIIAPNTCRQGTVVLDLQMDFIHSKTTSDLDLGNKLSDQKDMMDILKQKIEELSLQSKPHPAFTVSTQTDHHRIRMNRNHTSSDKCIGNSFSRKIFYCKLVISDGCFGHTFSKTKVQHNIVNGNERSGDYTCSRNNNCSNSVQENWLSWTS